MLRVFKVEWEHMPNPLTIIAPDDGAAIRIFDEWVEHHPPLDRWTMRTVSLVSPTELVIQPQLADAVRQGVASVVYFVGHRLGYLLAAPGEAQLGAIAPPEPEVRSFAVNDGAEETLVFARDLERARELFSTWNALTYGDDGEGAIIEEFSRWLLHGPRATLREDMDLGLTGVGEVAEDGFWHIYPADHEPTIER
jgi:hypothetical protein